ncbi:MAG TPA: ROK family protein [Terriglobia bacterium]|nr:ROK family protein [Terriglobia bacterium]
MLRQIGVLAAEHLAVGLVEGNQIIGSLRLYPSEKIQPALQALPAETIAQTILELVGAVAGGQLIEAIGVGFPGIIRDGVIAESPNLQQAKGFNLQATLSTPLGARRPVPALVCNDADAMAAGIAATQGHLDRFIRVWTLGDGIGFGRYPWTSGVWEGGHSVVTTDPKENYCGCGGIGHLEGFMGHRAMRLRFLDMEPEEIFENARAGDARCSDFVSLWHRALAAATATSIHMEGPGKFFVTGPNAQFVDLKALDNALHEMVKMSPLQGSVFEVIATSDEIGVIGAAVNAVHGVPRFLRP